MWHTGNTGKNHHIPTIRKEQEMPEVRNKYALSPHLMLNADLIHFFNYLHSHYFKLFA